VAFSVISLICSDFTSVLLCGDLVPSLEAGDQIPGFAGERKLGSEAGADGNGRDTSPRVARRCASGGGITREKRFGGRHIACFGEDEVCIHRISSGGIVAFCGDEAEHELLTDSSSGPTITGQIASIVLI
jgi:hypothetical protein